MVSYVSSVRSSSSGLTIAARAVTYVNVYVLPLAPPSMVIHEAPRMIIVARRGA